MKKPDASLHVKFERRGPVILATARVITPDDVIWYRSVLPGDVDLAALHRAAVLSTLRHLEKHGGPATRMTVQAALPAGDG